MQPYFYRIKHISTGRIYVGSQYGKRANPGNFFKTYFTSSRVVHQLIQEEGIESFSIEKIISINSARDYERRVLNFWYRKLGKMQFMEVFINRNISPGIVMDADTRYRLSKDPVKNAKIAKTVSGNTNVRGKAWWNNGTSMKRSVDCPGDGWFKGALKHSDETKQKRSLSNKGKKRTDEHKEKYSKARSKPGHNGNHKGTIWVIDECTGKKKRIKEKYE